MTYAFVTVNTDAGYSYKYGIGTFAYWIRGTGERLHGSGILKNKPSLFKDKPYECEMKAIINALTAIRKTNHPPIIGFIFNRDNIKTKSSKSGNELERMLYKEIQHFRKDAENRLGDKFAILTKKQKQYAIFRHVKAHSGVDDKRSWVNEWCDSQCKLRFKKWLQNNTVNNEPEKSKKGS